MKVNSKVYSKFTKTKLIWWLIEAEPECGYNSAAREQSGSQFVGSQSALGRPLKTWRLIHVTCFAAFNTNG